MASNMARQTSQYTTCKADLLPHPWAEGQTPYSESFAAELRPQIPLNEQFLKHSTQMACHQAWWAEFNPGAHVAEIKHLQVVIQLPLSPWHSTLTRINAPTLNKMQNK